MDNILKYGTLALLIVFIAWYFYDSGKQNAVLKQKLNQIEEIRKSLADSVVNLRKRTDDHDEKLRNALARNMDILDTLNNALIKVNKSTKIIDARIEKNQKEINDLWKNN